MLAAVQDFLVGLVAFVAGIALGAVAGFWFSEYVRRPKLSQAGSGGGGGAKLGYTSNVSVQNAAAFLGVNARESVILGRVIHGQWMKGLAVGRHPAKECRAWLIDAQSNENLGNLWWRHAGPDGAEFSQVVTLEADERAVLMLFAMVDQEVCDYFAFQPPPKDREAQSLTFTVPPERRHFREPRTFRVEVRYGYLHREVLRIPVEVTQPFGGNVHVQVRHR
jgi:hypothetical protein